MCEGATARAAAPSFGIGDQITGSEVQALALSTGRQVLPVKPEIAEAAYRQMREGDAESARLHLASIRRQLDAEEPAYRD